MTIIYGFTCKSRKKRQIVQSNCLSLVLLLLLLGFSPNSTYWALVAGTLRQILCCHTVEEARYLSFPSTLRPPYSDTELATYTVSLNRLWYGGEKQELHGQAIEFRVLWWQSDALTVTPLCLTTPINITFQFCFKNQLVLFPKIKNKQKYFWHNMCPLE